MNRLGFALASLLALGLSGVAHAQPAPLVSASIELPAGGPSRFLTVRAEEDHGLVLVGCLSNAAGTCFATSRVALSRSQARELRALVAGAEARMRCPPPRPQPGDPSFTLSTHGSAPGEFVGALPRDVAQMEPRTRGPCAASARLAWWLVRAFPGAS